MRSSQLRSLARPGLLALLAASPLVAQAPRPMALVHARVLTMTDQGVLDDATILIRDGVVEAVGTDVKVPAGTKVVDVAGGTVVPGLVQAWSEAGLGEDAAPSPAPTTRRSRFRGRRPGGRPGAKAQNHAATKVADALYARQDVFGDLLRQGVTTLVVRPSTPGFAGLAARLDPSQAATTDTPDRDALVVDDDAYLVIEPKSDAKTKQLIADSFDKAKEVLEARNKPAEKPAAKPAEKPAEEKKPAEAKPPAEGEKPKDGDEPKPEGDGEQEPKESTAKTPPEPAKPAPKKKVDPNLDAIADVIDGKRPAFVRVASAADVQHWLDGVGERRFPHTVLVVDEPNPSSGRIDQAIEQIKKLDVPVLMVPHFPNVPFTRELTNPALALHEAGIEVGFILPEGDRSLLQLRYQLIEMVRSGLPADVAWRAVTSVPAKLLGVDAEVGSIAPERRADLLVFDGNPLDPTTSLRTVYAGGREIAPEESAKR